MVEKTTSPEDNSQMLSEIADLRQILSERDQTIRVLSELLERYSVLLDESSDPIFMFDPDGTYRYVNQAFASGVQRKVEEIIDHKIWDIFSPEEADRRYAIVKAVFATGMLKTIEVRVPRSDEDRYYLTTAKPVKNETGNVLTVICISKDITDRKRMEEELRFMSTHDTLTGLYNRTFFEAELARLQNSRLYPISIALSDVDDLKLVNDRYGHTAGDDLIRRAAAMLHLSFRTEDVVARVGGDEFAVLLPETNAAAVRAALDRLHMSVAAQLPHQFPVRLSVGCATGEKGSNLADIMRQADEAMYADKRNKGLRRP